ncbi:MAG: PEGA domain-containing protein [Candidatus Magasanikbacteria bacterium]
MEYPGSHFTRPWRLAVLSLFILAFIIISPLLILYSSGYRYDFTNGIVQETGAISIDILPANAVTYLNDAKLETFIPVRLKNLAKGKYKIKLTAEGYYDWEKEVIVENKQTAYIKEIKLIQKSEPQKISDNKIDKLYLAENNNYIIYQTLGNPTTFWLKNLLDNTEEILIKGTFGKTYQVNWPVSKNNFVTITAIDYSEIYVINVEEPAKLWNLAKEEKNKIIKTQWGDSSQPEIFYSTKNQLIVINATTKQKSTIGKNNFLDWYVENGQIWTLQTTSTNQQLTVVKDTFGFSNILTQINNISNVDNRKINWRIIKTQNNSILLKKSDVSEMILLVEDKQFYFFGDKLLSSNFNNWWIMWTPWEITTYSQGEDPFLLNRSGEQLQKVIVLDEYNTLGLIWVDKMTALFPYYFVSHNLLNYKIYDAVADSQKRELYYSANINGQDGLWRINY